MYDVGRADVRRQDYEIWWEARAEGRSKSTYMLDDQDKAKPFENKEVKVTGTLDSATNTADQVTLKLRNR